MKLIDVELHISPHGLLGFRVEDDLGNKAYIRMDEGWFR